MNKGERNHLKRILQFALTVFPKPAIFVEPSKRALDNPSLWQNSKGMKFISSDDFKDGYCRLADDKGDEFEEKIYKPPYDETMEEAKKNSKKAKNTESDDDDPPFDEDKKQDDGVDEDDLF